MARNLASMTALLKDLASDASGIAKQWDRLSPLPGGKKIFSRALGLFVPYTGTIGAEVEDLRRGYARVILKDRRAVRNHLSSVHAIAMTNLVEMAGNLALLYSLPAGGRMIVTRITTDYLKKARGTLVAECMSPVPETLDRREYEFEVLIKDRSGDVVARGTLRSLVGPSSSPGRGATA